MRKTILMAALLGAAPALFALPSLAETVKGLRTVDEFDGIENETERSVALFTEMMAVIVKMKSL